MKRINGNFLTFIRRNALYLVLAFCILAIGLSITLVAVNNSGNKTIQQEKPPYEGNTNHPPVGSDDLPSDGIDEPTINPDDDLSDPVVSVIEFIMPVNTTEYTDYSETLVWSSTLNRFSSHTAMDFYAEEGAEVFAVYDGVVESVETTLLDGVTIVINHENGLKTVYNSLADGDMVSVGQAVVKGDVIGEVSITNRQEYKNGAHLHFEVLENGKSINPLNYLTVPEK